MTRTPSASRLLRPAGPKPAATRLSPAVLLSLQAFDAAFRLGSFRAAADILHLTPSAISHRIRSLEAVLGDRLFVRGHRIVAPTDAGRALAVLTGRAFMELARAAAPHEMSSAHGRLRLAMDPIFASVWLLPRIATFMAAWPEVELMVETVARPVDLENDPFDAVICAGTGPQDWPGQSAIHLMELSTTPMCRPDLAERLALAVPADLERAPLVLITTWPLAWSLWFARAGVPEIKPARAIWVDSFAAAVQAAERGVGVALGMEPICAERLAVGALCRPFAVSNPTGSCWLVHRPLDDRRPALRAFKTWLLGELAQGSGGKTA